MHGRGALLLHCMGCGGATPPMEIVGPYTGAPHRFVVDRIDLPKAGMPFAADLNGDGRVDNQFDNIVDAIASVTSIGEDPAAAAVAQVRAGTVAPVVELTSDDDRLQADPSVGVT